MLSSSQFPIVCLGEALIDRVVLASGESQDFPGGAPANVAAALALLGLPTALVGAVGEDADGQRLVKVLQERSVGCQDIQRVARPTRVVEVRCSEAGDRTFGGFIGGTPGAFADAHLAAEALPVALLQRTQALIVGTLGLAYPETRAAMERAISLVKAAGGRVVMDLNWRPTFWPRPEEALPLIESWLPQADWLKLSTEDAMALFDTAEVAWFTGRFPAAEGILITDGERGCDYAIAGHAGRLPAFSVTCQDTTGAGDAFLAGVIYQLANRGWTVPSAEAAAQMVTVASAMGALTTLAPGAIAAQPTLEQVQAFLLARTGKAWTL